MNREKIIIHIWSCLCVIFVTCYVSQFLFNTIKIWKLSEGTTIKFEFIGLGEICLIAGVYYLSKILLTNEKY